MIKYNRRVRTNSCKNPSNWSATMISKFMKEKGRTCNRKAESSYPCKKLRGERSTIRFFSAESGCNENLTLLEQLNGEKANSCMFSGRSGSPVIGGHSSVECTIAGSKVGHEEGKDIMGDDNMTSVGKNEMPQSSELQVQSNLASGGENSINLVPTETSNLLPATDCLRMEAEVVNIAIDSAADSHATSKVHQSLVSCLEGDSPCNIQNPHNDVSDRQAVAARELPVPIVEVNKEPVQNEEMPFIKSPFMWELVDSLEVFKLMPQKPHFRPLMKHKEARLEIFAIGYTMTFAVELEKISKLQITDPRDKFVDRLKTLAELAMYGFDVKLPMDCVNVLLSVKDEKEQLEGQSKEVDVQLAECSGENTKLDAAILAFDKVLKELGKELELLMFVAEKNKRHIANLRAADGVISENISAIEREIGSLVASCIAVDDWQ